MQPMVNFFFTLNDRVSKVILSKQGTYFVSKALGDF